MTKGKERKRMYKKVDPKSKQWWLLYQLYCCHSPSKGEGNIRANVIRHCNHHNIPVQWDKETGCLWYLNPGQPLLSAHLDQVQKQAPTIDDIVECGDRIFAPGFGLGADDKNGVFIILQEVWLRKESEHGMPSFILSVEEESISGKAKECFKLNFLDKDEKPMVPFGIVLDRRGSGDIIGWENGYCSKEFEEKVEEISQRKRMGYKATLGAYSDADGLSEYINCVNLSVGYYNPHTDAEETSKKDLLRAWNFTRHLLDAQEELAAIPFEGKPDYDLWDYRWSRKKGKKGKKEYMIHLSSEDVMYLCDLLNRREQEISVKFDELWDCYDEENGSVLSIDEKQVELEQEGIKINRILDELESNIIF